MSTSGARVGCCRSFWAKLTRRKVISDDVMNTQLSRVLSPLAVVLIGIGQMAGGGAFVVLGAAARDAGPGVVVSFAIGAVVAFTTGMCYAEFAATIPRAGSGYLFTYVTLGEFIAFVVGWQVILEELISVSSMASAISGAVDSMSENTISNYTVQYVGSFNHPMLAPYPDLVALFVGLLCVVVLLFGVHNSIFTSNLLNAVQLLVLVFCIVAGFVLADFSNWTARGFFPNGFRGVMEGAASSFYAYIGFEGVACSGEETANPRKTIPMALFTSLGVMVVLYLFQASALTLMIPFDEIDVQSAFPEAFETLGYPGLGIVVSLGIIVGLVGGLINGLYTLTRIIYAMAQDGLIYKIFGKVSKRTKTPLFGEVFFGILAAFLAVIFNVQILVEFLNVGTLIAYTIVSGCSIVLHYQSRVTVYDVQRLKHLAIENYEDPNDEIKAGKLKSRFTWLTACCPSAPAGIAVDVCVLLFAISVGCFVTMFIYAEEEIMNVIWWAVLLVILFGLGIIVTYLVIIMHHKRKLKLPYEIPSVPFIPALSMALNIFLMANLAGTTWARLAIWFAVGLLIYFSYGIWHSILEHPENALHDQDVESVDKDILVDPNFGVTDKTPIGVDERTPLISQNSNRSG